MKFFLLLGYSFVLVTAARGDDQLDSETTMSQSDEPVSETDAADQTTTTPPPAQPHIPTSATTSSTAPEESTTSSSLRTIPDTTLSFPDLPEENQLTQTVSSLAPETESSLSQEVSSTVPLTVTSTNALVSTALVSTLSPPHSTPNTEAPGVPEVSLSTTSQSLGTSTPTTPSLTAEGGVDFHSSPSTTVTLPPATFTQNSTEQESTATQTTTKATTTTTTTTGTDTPTTESIVATPDTTDATTSTTASSTSNTTSEVLTFTVTPMTNATSQPSGVCFGKTEVNTLVVVAVVVAVNVVSVVVTALCVHRLVSRRLSWDPPPIYRHRSTRSEKGENRVRGPAGRNLASDTECKASEGGRQTSTQIPILITNEDGWCVPYSNEAQEGKKKREKEVSVATEDTGV